MDNASDLLSNATDIRIYYTDIQDLMDLPGLPLLTPERRERLFRYRKAEDRARCLAAGLLIAKYIDAREPLRGRYGKPYFLHGPQFSLAHSGNFVTLAVAGMRIGTDIEKHAPWNAKVAERVFRAPELAWLNAAEDPEEAFYILWTAKESIMKADGAGFHMPPKTIAADPVSAAGIDATGISWRLCWHSLPGHTLCTAYRGPRQKTVLLPAPAEILCDLSK